MSSGMKLKPNPSRAASSSCKVRVDAPFKGTDGARIGGATVTFEPGARTAWHTHPLGQTLIVSAGAGYVQQEAHVQRSLATITCPPNGC